MFVFRKIWRAFFLETPVLRSPFYFITDDFTPVYKEKDPELIFPVFLKFSKEFIKSKSCIMLMTLSRFLCRYWQGFSSQYSLLSFIEQFKMALNKKEYARAFLMDVSRAFGTKNHQLLINELHAYGFTRNAWKTLFSYISDHWQSMAINFSFSSWSKLLS